MYFENDLIPIVKYLCWAYYLPTRGYDLSFEGAYLTSKGAYISTYLWVGAVFPRWATLRNFICLFHALGIGTIFCFKPPTQERDNFSSTCSMWLHNPKLNNKWKMAHGVGSRSKYNHPADGFCMILGWVAINKVAQWLFRKPMLSYINIRKAV